MGSKRDQGDGPDRRGEHGQDDEDQDKVIRLPRDWLGPRDELVPFGPSAERDDPEDQETASRPDDAPPPEAVSPDDFWGERSASLQGPLEEADDDSTSEPQRRRAWVVGAVAAAVVAVTILVLSLVGETSGPGKARVDAGVNRAGLPGALPLLPAQRSPASHPTPSRRRRSKTNRNSRSRPAGALAVNYVSESSSSQGAAAGGGASAGTGSSRTESSTTNSTSPSTGPSTSTPEENTQPPSNSSSGSRPASKAPAFGAGGALGPGHSPSG
jgi:hypothetical protein